MSGNFSVITPMSQSTISKAPTYTNAAQSAEQPAANPMLNHPRYQEPKKSHWFRNTLVTLVVLAAATGLGRKFLPKIFNPNAALAGGENLLQKGLHYAKLGVAKAGEFINSNIAKAYNAIAAKINSSAGTTPPAP